MASTGDFKLASMAAGFTLGFGFLTVWEAIKQTRRSHNPLRSAYIYMLWGEIAVNLIIAIIAWLFLDNVIGPTVPVLFFILFFWVLQVQLLLQIIINRIAIIAERQQTITYLKWGTAIFITLINIAVFCIWIPAHMVPPMNNTIVKINDVWDRMSKVLILIVDAGLNWYFLHVVQKRLVEQHQLTKYKPLVGFNAKLMLVSILMDGMLIGLMSLPNQVVYIQFHPVAYMVKLNIEMSMASLITRLARQGHSDQHYPSHSQSQNQTQSKNKSRAQDDKWADRNNIAMATNPKSTSRVSVESGPSSSEEGDAWSGIQRQTEFEITVETVGPAYKSKWPSATGKPRAGIEDEVPLTEEAGHPTRTASGNDS